MVIWYLECIYYNIIVKFEINVLIYKSVFSLVESYVIVKSV